MPQKETSRGGCLDTIVQIVTLGKLGVVTVKTYQHEKPGDFPGPIAGTPLERAYRERRPVFVIFDPKISRRIVRNK